MVRLGCRFIHQHAFHKMLWRRKKVNFNWRELGSLRFSVLFSCADQNNINFTTAPMEMNHYEVLEISRDAELIDIKKAYRRLALK